MIVLHRQRLIFLKPRKVAGTSFEIALSRFADDQADIVTPISPDDERSREALGFCGPQNFAEAGTASTHRFYNHMTAAEARERLSPEIWQGFTRVSIVRNPWDQLVSLFYWRIRNRLVDADASTFTAHFRAAPEFLAINHGAYLIGGDEVIDRFLRYEHLEQDILDLEKARPGLSGLWDTFQKLNAKGSIRDQRVSTAQIFKDHPDVNRWVEERNAWDIAKFGYRLPDHR